MKTWIMIKYNPICKSMVEIGLSGNKNNPPLASHMGGVWKRQIQSARAILSFLLKTHGQSLDESLNTLMTEVEGILNSRPITVETINDLISFQPLSHINLLTMKSKVVSPPPG